MTPSAGALLRRASWLLFLFASAATPAEAGAQDGSRQVYRQFFSTPQPSAGAGITTQILYKHPEDPDAKPIPVRREVFTFPGGTRFDPSVVPACDASNEEVSQEGEAACPPESRVLGGTGTAMSGFPLAGETGTEVDGFENGTGLTLLATVPTFGLRFVVRGVRNGRTFTVAFPPTPGGPPDGESALRRVHNIGIPVHAGSRAYVKTPPLCPPSGYWTFHGRFLYADGVEQSATSLMPCTPDLARPRIRIAGVPRGGCVSRGFRLRVRVKDQSALRRVHVRLDRRLIRSTSGARFSALVPARRLRPGRHRLSVAASDRAGNRSRRAVRFKRC